MFEAIISRLWDQVNALDERLSGVLDGDAYVRVETARDKCRQAIEQLEAAQILIVRNSRRVADQSLGRCNFAVCVCGRDDCEAFAGMPKGGAV